MELILNCPVRLAAVAVVGSGCASRAKNFLTKDQPMESLLYECPEVAERCSGANSSFALSTTNGRRLTDEVRGRARELLRMWGRGVGKALLV